MSAAKLKLACQLAAVRALLRPMLRWSHRRGERPGYSIVLGVPWMLRDLLGVNLDFMRRCDRANLDEIHIVFDRKLQPGGEAFVEQIRRDHGDLPLSFHWHAPVAGRLIERTRNASLFACMNWTLGLTAARTRYVLLHDFDLYPIAPDYFQRLYRTLRDQQLHFTAFERTYFDGLTDEDNILGTWSLGIDADWLRANFKPVHCFHAVAPVGGRLRSLDGLTHIETKTERRALCTPFHADDMMHVTNLCSIYLRYRGGRDFEPAWRLHLLWYLQYLAGDEKPMRRATETMRAGESSVIAIEDRSVDFSATHATCGNVVRKAVTRMENALNGETRPEVAAYLNASDRFWSRFGDRSTIKDAQGRVVWQHEDAATEKPLAAAS